MSYLPWLLFLVFVQSIATSLVQRGAYFFTEHRLDYSPTQNLLLALVVGVAYVAGALPGHQMSQRFGERRTIAWLMLLQIVCTLALGVTQATMILTILMVLISAANGMSWSIMESYVGAGHDPRQVSRAIGFYNISWALGVPLAMWSSGAIIGLLGSWLFVFSGLLTLLSLGIFWWRMPPAPNHAPLDNPQRPDANTLKHYRMLTLSSRWSLVASYSMAFVLTPLMPSMFKAMGLSVQAATLLAGVSDAARAVTFIVMQRTHRWHGWRSIPAAAAILLPAGFLLTLLGGNIWWVILGLTGLGLGAGLAYFGSLYYAMVVANGSVEAGSKHEGLIGSGFSLGPLMALVGRELGQRWQAPLAGTLAGVVPLMVVCLGGALYPLFKTSLPRSGSKVS